jgi:two-component system, OmpR family, phosphate regulon sensor histidine kinase PhoR
LTAPWENDRTARASRELLAKAGFGKYLRECERAEFEKESSGGATQSCEQAVSAARHPIQAAYARFVWARVLDQAGRHTDSLRLYRDLAGGDPSIADEDGVPLALLAAQRLVPDGASTERILASGWAAMKQSRWLPPLACYALSDISARLTKAAGPGDGAAVEEFRREIAARIRRTQHVEELQNDWPRLGLEPGGRRWTLYGEEPWMIGAFRSAEGGGVLIALAAREVFAAFPPAFGSIILHSADGRGAPLGDEFAGVRILFPGATGDVDASGIPWSRLFQFAVVLVAAATMFAGYLLWRDLRRELKASELRTQFVSSISHELKTPLTAIRMYAETLQMGRTPDAQSASEYLETIVRESERLSRLVDGVLLFSKTEQGKHAYRMRPTALPEVIEAAARAIEHPTRQQGFRFRTTVETGLPLVEADRDALEQAVLNLLSNAIKYSGDSRDIELAAVCQDGEAVIRVTDHGVGIAPEEHTRIFEKFYRAPTRENQLLPGTGLGLALVAQIVKAHRGRVEVSSAPGEGSTFSIYLPLERKDEPDSRN